MARNRAGLPRGLVFAGRYSLFFNWPCEVEAVEWVSLSPVGTVFRRPINYALLPYTAVTCIERSYTRLYVLLRLECSKYMTASATRILDTVPGDTIRKIRHQLSMIRKLRSATQISGRSRYHHPVFFLQMPSTRRKYKGKCVY